jgi:hypothetical protein
VTPVVPDASVIDLGVPSAEGPPGGGPRRPTRLGRRLLAAALAMVCLLVLAASARGRPVLGDPLWTGSVSLNGFTLGARNLYAARPEGTAVTAVDLVTGRPRWSDDITGLPDATHDLGNGVAVVTTRPPATDSPRRPELTITLVREATGERFARTAGTYYLQGADGRLLLVFSERSTNPDSCAMLETNCTDVTAWDVGTGTVAWRLNLAPDTGALPSYVDDRVDALAEFDRDGTVRLHDVSTGTVTATMSMSPQVLLSGGQVGLVGDVLLTAQRGRDGITLTAYRRPSLERSWSVVVADHTPMDDRGRGTLIVSACGSDACLTIIGASTRVIDLSTGSVTPPIGFDVVQRIGDGVFLAGQLNAAYGAGGTGPALNNGFIIAPDGRRIATLTVVGLVDWSDSGDRGLVTQEGPNRTGFLLIDGRGNVRSLGSVPGTRLTCHARADIVACADPGGALRVFRLPI